MNILALETSTSYASIAVAKNGQLAAEVLINTERTLSARLVSEIDRVVASAGITLADIDIYAASKGPGSFTGVRGGMATIQGLALATGAQCVAFSSLALLAMNCSFTATLVCPLLDARKQEVYAALYDCSAALPLLRHEEAVLPPALLLKQLANQDDSIIFLGDGTQKYHDLITTALGSRAIIAPFHLHTPRAANGIALALHAVQQNTLCSAAQLLPNYLRASDAEIAKVQKTS